MNILIDVTQIPVKKTGVGVYAFNLLKELAECDGLNSYFLLAQNDDKELNSIHALNFKLIWVNSKYFRHFILRCFLEQFYTLFLILKYNIKVVHSLHYSFPLLAQAKKVVTIHDLSYYKFPKSHIFVKRHYFRVFIKMASILADRIISDSKSTAEDLLIRFNVVKHKTFVVYLGKSNMFNSSLNGLGLKLVKEKYGLSKEYFLYLGTIEPRKNIKKIILAFFKYLNINQSFQLVIAGKKGWFFDEVFRLVDRLNLREKVKFIGFVEETDKPYLIAGSKIFIYPSIYEGFGIPVLEAMACGIPTITSNVSSLPEVAGDAALLVNPQKVEEIYLAIRRLTEDKELYEDLRKRSIQQAKKFSWENTARETIKVYNSL